ncbi:MAG: prolipoprotein diacylglyceryl transferase, partial [Aquificaceae bacterium]|nr:prolipoprotein diacylglyceryl transferase [Aquificaceae bacterium]
MFPVLFEIFGIKVHTYGVLVALGAFASYYLALKLSVKNGINPEKIENTFLMTLFLGIFGARIAYILEHPDSIKSFLDLFAVWQGGMSFFGGLGFGIVGAFLGVLIYKLPIWKIADIAMISLTLGHAIGRLGCTAAGCCYGKPFGVGNISPGLYLSDRFPFFYVVFPQGGSAPSHIPLYPTQLMEFLGLLLVFGVLLTIYLKFKPRDGTIFALYMLLYGALRFFLEFF